MIAVAVVMIFLCGCRENITGVDSLIAGHAILKVTFSSSPEKDETLLRNVLRIGGSLECGYDSEYANFLRSYDENFDMAAASDSNGKYRIHPAVLNWISSKGWKFQQKFCINLNEDNAEYYFVK